MNLIKDSDFSYNSPKWIPRFPDNTNTSWFWVLIWHRTDDKKVLMYFHFIGKKFNTKRVDKLNHSGISYTRAILFSFRTSPCRIDICNKTVNNNHNAATFHGISSVTWMRQSVSKGEEKCWWRCKLRRNCIYLFIQHFVVHIPVPWDRGRSAGTILNLRSRHLKGCEKVHIQNPEQRCSVIYTISQEPLLVKRK